MALSVAERVLVKRAIRRDPEAFSEIYLKYQPAVSRHINYLVGNRQDADDITSEAFLRAWHAIDRFEDRGLSIEPWLLKIGYNLSCRFLERRRADRLDAETDIPDSKPLPEAVFETVAREEALRVAIRRLPVVQRQVVVLRFIDNMDSEDIAKIIGKSSGAVRVIQHRALRALKLLLNPGIYSELSGENGRPLTGFVIAHEV